MTTEKKLTYLPVDSIIPHIDNPRKELGDLTELAESIKAKGIMQNLTVVPCPARGEGTYVVIIGHRRLAAAKLAGLSEVPCVITEMSHEEQVATMLLENIQRQDLTPYEQAQGFQMMMDFGETVNTISEKTGFSKSTVRRRLEMAKLDQGKLEKKCKTHQITLFEIDKLSEIEDLEERNKVLDKVGTKDYDWAYKKAVDEQEKRKGAAAWTAALSRHGVTNVEYNKIHSSAYDNCDPSYASVREDPEEILTKTGAEFAAISSGYVYLRKKKAKEEAKKADAAAVERSKQEQERQARVNALKDACERAKACRMDWIRENGKKFILKEREVVDLLLDVFLDYEQADLGGEGFCPDTFLAVCGVKDYDSEDPEKRHELRSVYPNETLVRFAYACLEDNYNWRTYNSWYGTYEASPAIKALYVFLGAIGYEPSDEEVALIEGTSALYVQKEEKTDA
jgi:ParB family chromosome partitioning protein